MSTSEFYKWFAIKEFTWDRTGGDPITQGNRNPLLYKNIGADGIKTGYLAVEKYSLASSLIRKGRRLIAVGSGFETKSSRSRESSKLLTYGLTVEPTASFWDAGEYIATSAKLQVGHPPGAPLFQMLGAFFAMFAFSPEKVALMVNFMSVFSSAFSTTSASARRCDDTATRTNGKTSAAFGGFISSVPRAPLLPAKAEDSAGPNAMMAPRGASSNGIKSEPIIAYSASICTSTPSTVMSSPTRNTPRNTLHAP